jgi:hypothetical protein
MNEAEESTELVLSDLHHLDSSKIRPRHGADDAHAARGAALMTSNGGRRH